MAEAGTKTMILDCGGGNGRYHHSPRVVHRTDPPEGAAAADGPWGSSSVDNEFMKWCMEFLGKEEFGRVCRTSAFYSLLTQWEQGKTSFAGGHAEQVRLNMVDISRRLGFDKRKMQVALIAPYQIDSRDTGYTPGLFSNHFQI